ncbi:MAG: hypothetical protein HYX65_04895 [Gemmatimonadetes bacterium]|nr:hypothetical protein [Gemmatimonadota bacterium]
MRAGRVRRRGAGLLAALLLGAAPLVPGAALAQGQPGPGLGRPVPSDRQQRAEERPDRLDPPQGGPGGERRMMLEQSIRRRFAEVVRNRLQLDNRQMQQLVDVNRKFEGRRRELNMRERDARQSLRGEVERDRQADNPRVATALQELLAIQKERAALLESEDKDLSSFLSPVQRAKYLALQEQLRRRVEEMRRRDAGGMDPMGGPPGGPPPGGPPGEPPGDR